MFDVPRWSWLAAALALALFASTTVHAQAPGMLAARVSDSAEAVLVTRDGRLLHGADATSAHIPASEILYQGHAAPLLSDVDGSPGARYEYIRFRPPDHCHQVEDRTPDTEGRGWTLRRVEHCESERLRLYRLEGEPRLLCDGACELLLRRGSRQLGLADENHQTPIASVPRSVMGSTSIHASLETDAGLELATMVGALLGLTGCPYVSMFAAAFLHPPDHPEVTMEGAIGAFVTAAILGVIGLVCGVVSIWAATRDPSAVLRFD